MRNTRPAIARRGVERAIRRRDHAPDHRLLGSEKRVELWRQRKPPIASQGNAVELAFTKSEKLVISHTAEVDAPSVPTASANNKTSFTL